MHGALQLPEIGLAGTFASNEHGVPTGSGGRIAHNLPQSALDAVSDHSFSDALSGYEAEAAAIQSVGQNAHHQQSVGDAPPATVDLGDATGGAEPMLPLHRLKGTGGVQNGQRRVG